jgi:hypothetical protein
VEKTRQGWIAFLDIYAFGSFLDDDTLSLTTSNLMKLQNRLNVKFKEFKGLKKSKDYDFIMFSDTIVIWIASSQQDLRPFRIISEMVAIASDEASEYNFLYRGCCSFGDIIIGPKFVLGDAYLRAYKMEDSGISMPFVICPDKELQIAQISEMTGDLCKCVEHKNGTSFQAIILSKVPESTIIEISRRNITRLVSNSQKNDEDGKNVQKYIEIWEKLFKMTSGLRA